MTVSVSVLFLRTGRRIVLPESAGLLFWRHSARWEEVERWRQAVAAAAIFIWVSDTKKYPILWFVVVFKELNQNNLTGIKNWESVSVSVSQCRHHRATTTIVSYKPALWRANV